jgi:hypothetical protein
MREDTSRPTSRRAAGSRQRGPALLFVAAAAVLFRSAPADAQVKTVRVPVRLEYTRGRGAERCPDEAFLRGETSVLLGYDPFEADAPLTITAHVERQGRELVASMEMLDREGQTPKADGIGTTGGCKTLIASVALVISVWIWKPAEPPEPLAPACTAAPVCPPALACPACPPPSSAPELPRCEKLPPALPAAVPAERVRMDIGVGAVTAAGMMPGVAVGMGLSLGVRQSDWSFALEGRGFASLAREIKSVPIATSAFVAAAVVCPRFRPFLGCMLAEVGTWRFVPQEPRGDITPRDAPFLAFATRLGGEWSLSERLSVHGYAEGIVPAWAATLRRGGNGASTSERVLWTPLPVGVAFAVGLTATY